MSTRRPVLIRPVLPPAHGLALRLLLVLLALVGLAGCDHAVVGQPLEGDEAAAEPIAAPPTKEELMSAAATPRADDLAPKRFSWLDEGVLAGLAHPASFPLGLDGSLDYLVAEEVVLLVILSGSPIASEALKARDMEGLHLPVVDFTPPSPEQIDTFVAEVAQRRTAGEPVAVHCGADLGRTGTMLASWLVSEGLGAQDAIDTVRELRPGSIETASQEDAIFDYASRLGRPASGSGPLEGPR